jgi:hypothetical protein
MISLTTAKFLLFLALCLGPKDGNSNQTIEITSKNSYIVWTQGTDGWTVVQKGLAGDDWPSNGTLVSTADLNNFRDKHHDYVPDVRAVKGHDWPAKGDSKIYLEDGNLVEKQGYNKVFYTIEPGGYNQRVFVIQAMQDGKPL